MKWKKKITGMEWNRHGNGMENIMEWNGNIMEKNTTNQEEK